MLFTLSPHNNLLLFNKWPLNMVFSLRLMLLLKPFIAIICLPTTETTIANIIIHFVEPTDNVVRVSSLGHPLKKLSMVLAIIVALVTSQVIVKITTLLHFLSTQLLMLCTLALTLMRNCSIGPTWYINTET